MSRFNDAARTVRHGTKPSNFGERKEFPVSIGKEEM